MRCRVDYGVRAPTWGAVLRDLPATVEVRTDEEPDFAGEWLADAWVALALPGRSLVPVVARRHGSRLVVEARPGGAEIESWLAAVVLAAAAREADAPIVGDAGETIAAGEIVARLDEEWAFEGLRVHVEWLAHETASKPLVEIEGAERTFFVNRAVLDKYVFCDDTSDSRTLCGRYAEWARLVQYPEASLPGLVVPTVSRSLHEDGRAPSDSCSITSAALTFLPPVDDVTLVDSKRRGVSVPRAVLVDMLGDLYEPLDARQGLLRPLTEEVLVELQQTATPRVLG